VTTCTLAPIFSVVGYVLAVLLGIGLVVRRVELVSLAQAKARRGLERDLQLSAPRLEMTRGQIRGHKFGVQSPLSPFARALWGRAKGERGGWNFRPRISERMLDQTRQPT